MKNWKPGDQLSNGSSWRLILGVKPASRWNIFLDFEVPDEAFTVLELEENSLAGKSGKVVYPNEYIEV